MRKSQFTCDSLSLPLLQPLLIKSSNSYPFVNKLFLLFTLIIKWNRYHRIYYYLISVCLENHKCLASVNTRVNCYWDFLSIVDGDEITISIFSILSTLYNRLLWVDHSLSLPHPGVPRRAVRVPKKRNMKKRRTSGTDVKDDTCYRQSFVTRGRKSWECRIVPDLSFSVLKCQTTSLSFLTILYTSLVLLNIIPRSDTSFLDEIDIQFSFSSEKSYLIFTTLISLKVSTLKKSSICTK